jgi:DHA1 family chloramphenicol resistance protein-like MFS transporter
VFTLAADAPTLAGATAVSAFQLGISLVPLFAGLGLESPAGIVSLPLIGAVLALATIPAVLLDRLGSAT